MGTTRRPAIREQGKNKNWPNISHLLSCPVKGKTIVAYSVINNNKGKSMKKWLITYLVKKRTGEVQEHSFELVERSISRALTVATNDVINPRRLEDDVKQIVIVSICIVPATDDPEAYF